MSLEVRKNRGAYSHNNYESKHNIGQLKHIAITVIITARGQCGGVPGGGRQLRAGGGECPLHPGAHWLQGVHGRVSTRVRVCLHHLEGGPGDVSPPDLL